MYAYPGVQATFMAALRAEAGTALFPGPAGQEAVPIWGYRNLSVPGSSAQVPGPVIEARAGGLLHVNLENGLAEPVSIALPGQEIVPQPVKDESGRFLSYTEPAPPGGGVTYSFVATRPGTFLYESGTQPERQVAMGLYGLLIVRPRDFHPDRPFQRTAYGPATAYDRELTLVLADVDTRLNRAVAAGNPYDWDGYAPDCWLINGRSYPATLDPDGAGSQPYGASLQARTGETILLRCANAGFRTHSLCFGGLVARVIAQDGYPKRAYWPDTSYQKTALTIAPGQTYDLLLRPREAGEYYLYDRALMCALNAGEFPGGMVTRIVVT